MSGRDRQECLPHQELRLARNFRAFPVGRCASGRHSDAPNPTDVRAGRQAKPAGKQRGMVLNVADVVDLVVQLR